MLAFLPSLLFFVLAPLTMSLALWLGFAAAFAVGIRAFAATRSIRLFDAAGLILFGGLALYTAFVNSEFSPTETALVLDSALLAVILWSMAARRPFTADYSWLKGEHPPERIARADLLLTAVWATAYALMAAIAAAAVVLHRLAPGWANVWGLVVFAATLTFTWQFGAYIDRQATSRPGRR